MSEQGLSTPYPREQPPTLIIEGDLALLRSEVPTAIRTIRRALVTGGRGLLDKVRGQPRYDFRGADGWTVTFRLTPDIEHRLRTSGGTLTDEEITKGMEQVREDEENLERRIEIETMQAHIAACEYAADMLHQALDSGDEAALGRAYEWGRKAIDLGRRLEKLGLAAAERRAAQPPRGPYPGTDRRHSFQNEWRDGRLVNPERPGICVHLVGVTPGFWCGECMAAAPVSVATGAASAGPPTEKDDDSGDQPVQTLPTEGSVDR